MTVRFDAVANLLTHGQIYYHLEYVGFPRSYKWMNTNSCVRLTLLSSVAETADARNTRVKSNSSSVLPTMPRPVSSG